MTTTEYTWEDLQKAVGRDFSGGLVRTGADPIERSHIRRFCEPLEMDFPLFFDDAVARQHGYKGIIAPVSMYRLTGTQPAIWSPGDPTRWPAAERNALMDVPQRGAEAPLPSPKTTQGFVTDVEMEYLAPVYVGDHLSFRGQKLVSATVRETSVGFGAFIVFESEILNQRGEVVAKTRNGNFRYNPHPGGPRRQEARQSASVQGDPPAPRVVPPAQASYVEWRTLRYFEDVKEGDEVSPVTFNITVQRLVIEAGGHRDFAAFHHNTDIARAQGAPEMYSGAISIQGMWERTYREFLGLGAVIKKVGPFRLRSFNTAGDSVVTKGTVRRKWRQDGENMVELEMWSENSRGVSVGPGPVVAALPSRPRP